MIVQYHTETYIRKKSTILINILFLFICFASTDLLAQNQQKIDSLELVLTTSISDREKIDTWNQLALEYSSSDSSLTYFYTENAINLSKKIDYAKGIVIAKRHRGWFLIGMGYTDEAKKLFSETLQLAEEAQITNEVHKILSDLGSIAFNTGDMAQALELFNKSLTIQKQVGDQYGIINSYLNIALVNGIQGKYEESLDYDFKALDIATELKSDKHLARCYNNIATHTLLLGQYKKSFEYFTKALAIFESTSNKSRVALVYTNLGEIFSVLGNYLEALKYTFKALELYKEVNNRGNTATNYNRIGIIYMRMEDYEKASEILLKAADMSEQASDALSLTYIYRSLGHTYRFQNEFEQSINSYEKALNLAEKMGSIKDKLSIFASISETYIASKEYDKAKKVIAQGLEICAEKSTGFKEEHVLLLTTLGRLLLKRNDFLQAKRYLDEGMSLAQKTQNSEIVRDIAEVLTEVEEKLSNYENAYKAHLLFKTMSDSILNEEKANQVLGLQIQYETEQKEQKIKSLEQEAEIQELELQQSTLKFTILTVVLLLFLLTGGVFYLLSRQQRLQLENKTQNIEQKLLRVQMNPHFIFNALTSIQEYVFNAESSKAGLYLMKFSKLMRQILENSRNEYISLEQEVNMLENYLSLQNLRQKTPFEYHIKVEDDLDIEEIMIPPMFAQPFVENAIEHGISTIAEKGKIEIHFALKENQIMLTIRDNGIGIQKSTEIQSQNIEKYQSLATQITKERVNIFKKNFRKNIAFEVNNLSQGTQVIFFLPYQFA